MYTYVDMAKSNIKRSHVVSFRCTAAELRKLRSYRWHCFRGKPLATAVRDAALKGSEVES
jgi:hypothetical protein